MIAALFAAAVVGHGNVIRNNVGPAPSIQGDGNSVTGNVWAVGGGGSGARPYSIPGVVGPILGAEVEVCSSDPNRPDLTVCISGAAHRIRLFMPYPPCGTPEAKAAPRCAEWKIGRPW